MNKGFSKILVIIILLIVLSGFYLVQNKKTDLNKINDQIIDEDNLDTSPSNIKTNKKLDLSSQGLTKAPNYIFNMTGIDELNLSDNEIDGALQAEIRNLKNLKVLNLNNNKFTGVPAEVGQLTNLEILDLSNNPVTGLPYEIQNLKKLKILDLRGTNYSEQDLDIIKQGLSSDVLIKI